MKQWKMRVLVLMKPFDMYPSSPPSRVDTLCRIPNSSKVLEFLDNRRKVHKDATYFCHNMLNKKSIHWEPLVRSNLSQPIRNVDLVVTIGGDGTLLQASHFINNSIPVLGVNSDPSQPQEVETLKDEFDANRSTGYLCAATVNNFEKVLDDILDGQTVPSNLTRMEISINSQTLSTYALNDILIAHPCPATVSRFSLKIISDGQPWASPLAHCRASGLRVSTSAGSTAAILSAGGYKMPISSHNLQYKVREPISPGVVNARLMHGLIKADQYMDTAWFCTKGLVYIDGSHLFHPIVHGDTIQISSKAPVLKVFLPRHLL